MPATDGFADVVARCTAAAAVSVRLAAVLSRGHATALALVESCGDDTATTDARVALAEQVEALEGEAEALSQEHGAHLADLEPRVLAVAAAMRRRAREDGRPKVMTRLRRELRDLGAAWEAVRRPVAEAVAMAGRKPPRLLSPGEN
jgi:hypothetical protein